MYALWGAGIDTNLKLAKIVIKAGSSVDMELAECKSNEFCE